MVEVNEKKGKPLPLYVYSTNTDSIRSIHITPNKNWGGTGSLGCDIGFGYLHRIPLNRNLPSTTTQQQQQQLQQLQMQYPPIQTPPGFPVQTQVSVQQPTLQTPVIQQVPLQEFTQSVVNTKSNNEQKTIEEQLQDIKL